MGCNDQTMEGDACPSTECLTVGLFLPRGSSLYFPLLSPTRSLSPLSSTLDASIIIGATHPSVVALLKMLSPGTYCQQDAVLLPMTKLLCWLPAQCNTDKKKDREGSKHSSFQDL